MPKTVDPPPVEVNDSSNRSIIYIVILLCIVTIVSYFMYKVYKKLQVLNEDVITVNNKGDNLNSSNKEYDRKLDILAENLKRVENSIVKPTQKLEPPKHVDINLDKNETVDLEDITEE
tara:strand:+ start:615 stop:968 length:354 start_codon:yes stop_codon:yes gene_type:complete